MFKLTKYNDSVDLNDFYNKAAQRGYENNSNQKIMIDSLRNERDWAFWLLYYNEQIVGTTGAHSLNMFDHLSYRICVRTCVLTDLLPFKHLRKLDFTIKKHQNVTAQFLIPVCIEYCPSDADLYITSNKSPVASQNLVHTIFCPALASIGALTKTCEAEYRGHTQTFWKLNKETFMKQLIMNKWSTNV